MITVFNNPEQAIILFAVLLKKLGGEISITQSDIDEVSYNALREIGHADGRISFILQEKPSNLHS